MDDIVSRIRLQFLTRGVLGARELTRALRVSQPSISRALARMGPSVLRLGSGPATRYGLISPIGTLGHSWPLYLIDQNRTPREVGVLHSLTGPAWWLETPTGIAWKSLAGDQFPDAVFPGLPWFLDDLRPQGFLGRAFARRHGNALEAGFDPNTWSERAVAEALLRFGSDLPGGFVLGQESLANALLPPSEGAISVNLREAAYPRLAEESLAGGIPRSSAGGEQPKFTATILKPDGPAAVIVKFSPPMTTPEGRRWADLLAAEAMATSILARAGWETATTEWLDAGGRRFLEITRFDRTPQSGRIPHVSLRAHDAAFFGKMDTPWIEAAKRLQSQGWLNDSDAEKLASLWRFGRLIANTDMHYGNAALLLTERLPLRLAPAYDMLPMGYRPGLENQIPDLSEEMLAVAHSEMRAAPERSLAALFWAKISEAGHISDSFRKIATAHATALER